MYDPLITDGDAKPNDDLDEEDADDGLTHMNMEVSQNDEDGDSEAWMLQSLSSQPINRLWNDSITQQPNAVETLEELAERFPDNPFVLNALGEAILSHKLSKQSVDHAFLLKAHSAFNRAASRMRSWIVAHPHLSVSDAMETSDDEEEEDDDDDDDAEKEKKDGNASRSVVRVSPDADFPLAECNDGSILLRMKHFGEAIQRFERVVTTTTVGKDLAVVAVVGLSRTLTAISQTKSRNNARAELRDSAGNLQLINFLQRLLSQSRKKEANMRMRGTHQGSYVLSLALSALTVGENVETVGNSVGFGNAKKSKRSVGGSDAMKGKVWRSHLVGYALEALPHLGRNRSLSGLITSFLPSSKRKPENHHDEHAYSGDRDSEGDPTRPVSPNGSSPSSDVLEATNRLQAILTYDASRTIAPLHQFDPYTSRAAESMCGFLRVGFMLKGRPNGTASSQSQRQAARIDAVNLALQEKGLRDELILQCCRHVTENPSTVQTVEGWQTLVLCCYSFSPSPRLRKYFEIFVTEHSESSNSNVALLAAFCLSALAKRSKRDTLVMAHSEKLKEYERAIVSWRSRSEVFEKRKQELTKRLTELREGKKLAREAMRSSSTGVAKSAEPPLLVDTEARESSGREQQQDRDVGDVVLRDLDDRDVEPEHQQQQHSHQVDEDEDEYLVDEEEADILGWLEYEDPGPSPVAPELSSSEQYEVVDAIDFSSVVDVSTEMEHVFSSTLQEASLQDERARSSSSSSALGGGRHSGGWMDSLLAPKPAATASLKKKSTTVSVDEVLMKKLSGPAISEAWAKMHTLFPAKRQKHMNETAAEYVPLT